MSLQSIWMNKLFPSSVVICSLPASPQYLSCSHQGLLRYIILETFLYSWKFWPSIERSVRGSVIALFHETSWKYHQSIVKTFMTSQTIILHLGSIQWVTQICMEDYSTMHFCIGVVMRDARLRNRQLLTVT